MVREILAAPELGKPLEGRNGALDPPGTSGTQGHEGPRDCVWFLSRDVEIVKSLLGAWVRTPTWCRREGGIDGN